MIIAGVAFLLIFLAIAFVAFKLLKRTVKIAFRMVIVAVIVAIAIAGAAFFMYSGISKSSRPPAHSQIK